MPAKKKKAPKKKQVAPAPETTPAAAAATATTAPAPAVPVEERTAAPTAPEVRGKIRVKYSIYDNEYETTDGAVTMEALDDELAISFAFPGEFRATLRRADGAAVVEGAGVGLATTFRGCDDGAAYVLEVEEDPARAVDGVAYKAPAASTGDVSRRTASAHAVTAELRALAPDQLQGAKYEQLLEARDVEDVLFGSG